MAAATSGTEASGLKKRKAHIANQAALPLHHNRARTVSPPVKLARSRSPIVRLLGATSPSFSFAAVTAASTPKQRWLQSPSPSPPHSPPCFPPAALLLPLHPSTRLLASAPALSAALSLSRSRRSPGEHCWLSRPRPTILCLLSLLSYRHMQPPPSPPLRSTCLRLPRLRASGRWHRSSSGARRGRSSSSTGRRAAGSWWTPGRGWMQQCAGGTASSLGSACGMCTHTCMPIYGNTFCPAGIDHPP
jgi:hypothetical protein